MNLRGTTKVREHLATWLAATYPDRVDDLRVAWDIDDELLPLPAKYMDREHEEIDTWPTVSVVIPRKPKRRRIEPDDFGNPQWLSVYTVELYGWTKGEGWDGAIDIRDNTAAALEWHLLDLPRVGSDNDMLIDEDTLSVEYGDVIPLKGERFTSAVLLAFELRVTETIPRANLGTVVDVVPIVEPID